MVWKGPRHGSTQRNVWPNPCRVTVMNVLCFLCFRKQEYMFYNIYAFRRDLLSTKFLIELNNLIKYRGVSDVAVINSGSGSSLRSGRGPIYLTVSDSLPTQPLNTSFY